MAAGASAGAAVGIPPRIIARTTGDLFLGTSAAPADDPPAVDTALTGVV